MKLSNVLFFFLLPFNHAHDVNNEPPLKVFILVGQSNMVGHGYVDRRDELNNPLNGTLEWLVNQDRYANVNLKNESGAWREREDVDIIYNKQDNVDKTPAMNAYGRLTVGPYGGNPGDHMHMGPELGFGWTLGDMISGQRILLVKVAWGGKSLSEDFRPPSSGGEIGPYYRALIQHIKLTLNVILPSKFPSYSGSYDIMGIGWHQGWHDRCSSTMAKEYEFNLANLIRDVREDLKCPNLPFVIGITGQFGYQTDEDTDVVIQAQLAVSDYTKYPEFLGTVASVETRDFARDKMPSSPGDEIYHWNNNCESYWLIGKAMGEAMFKLIMSSSPFESSVMKGVTKIIRVKRTGSKKNIQVDK